MYLLHMYSTYGYKSTDGPPLLPLAGTRIFSCPTPALRPEMASTVTEYLLCMASYLFFAMNGSTNPYCYLPLA